MLHFASSSSDVWLRFPAKNNARSALHFTSLHIAAWKKKKRKNTLQYLILKVTMSFVLA